MKYQAVKNYFLPRSNFSTGSISVDGASGSGSSGGGSGGGIYIEATGLDGHGTISSNGGDGLDQGGAGAGGRISIHLLQRFVLNIPDIV